MAGGYNSSIAFLTDRDEPTNDYYHDVSAMDDDTQVYTKCKISKLTGEGAVWIVYSEKHYGRAGGGVGQSRVVLPSATESQVIQPGFRIQSAQAFNITQPCICLFEHSNYRGNKLPTEHTIDDIKQHFPPGEVTGLSSCVATSGLWKVFTKPASHGTSRSVDATNGMKEVPFFDSLNDKLQSVQLIRAS